MNGAALLVLLAASVRILVPKPGTAGQSAHAVGRHQGILGLVAAGVVVVWALLRKQCHLGTVLDVALGQGVTAGCHVKDDVTKEWVYRYV